MAFWQGNSRFDPIADDPHSVAGDAASFARRYRLPVMILVAVVAVAAIVLWLMNRPAGDDAATAPPSALTVRSATPRLTRWPRAIEASGSIAAWQEASIGTQIGSYRLIEVAVNVGDQVRKGQVLARMDPALIEAEILQLAAANDQAKANRERALSLQRAGAISDQDVLQFVTAAKTASALLAAKRLQLRYTQVTAPDDGVISARIATLGAVVPVGQELFRLIRQNRLEWRGELTAAQIGAVANGEKVALALPDGGTAEAVVRQRAPSLDGQSRLGLVYADIRPGSRARAGMYAGGRIVTGAAPALVVPAASVIVRDGRDYVMAIRPAGTATRVEQRLVDIGRRQGDLVEIVGGLTPRDSVVTTGADFLNDGDIVRVAGTAIAAASPVTQKGTRP